VEMAAAMVGCKGAASAGRRWLPSTPLRLRPRGPGSSLNLADVGRRRAVRAPAPSARTRADADHGGAARPAGRGGERRRRTGRGWEQWRRPSLPVEHLGGDVGVLPVSWPPKQRAGLAGDWERDERW